MTQKIEIRDVEIPDLKKVLNSLHGDVMGTSWGRHKCMTPSRKSFA